MSNHRRDSRQVSSVSNTFAPNRRFLRNVPLFVIVIVAIVGVYTLRDRLGFEALSENRDTLIAFRDANYLVAAVVFVAVYVAIVAFSLPGATIATLTGGFLFGTLHGTVLNVSGAALGAIVIFQAARMGLGAQLSARLDASEGMVRKIKQGIKANQWSMLFSIRLIPVVPFFVANLVPAFLEVPLHRFAISTFVGIIPGALVYTSVGAGLGEVFATGATPDLGIIFKPHVLLPILGLAVLSLLPVIVKLFRKNQTAASAHHRDGCSR